MRWIIGVILFCLWGGLVYARDEKPWDMETFLSGNPEAIEVFDAISQIGRRIEADPEQYPDYEALASAYEYLGLFEKARQAQILALRYYPLPTAGREVLLGNLTRIYFHLDMLAAAKETLDLALALNPHHTPNLTYLLYYYIQTRDYTAAAPLMQRLQQAETANDLYYHFYLGSKEHGVAEEEVIHFLQAAVAIDPENHLALRALAVALRDAAVTGNGDFSESIRLLRTTIRRKPRYAPAYIALADTYLLLADTAGRKMQHHYARLALQWIRKARALEPHNRRLDLMQGSVWVMTGRYAAAIEPLEALYSRNILRSQVAPQLAAAYEGKARGYYLRGRNLRYALSLVQDAVRLAPRNPLALRTQAGILLRLKEYDAAYRAALEGLLLKPHDTQLVTELETIKTVAEQRKSR